MARAASRDIVILGARGKARLEAIARVGLEDSLWLGPGELAPSNAAQELKVRQILEGMGLEVATPAEAREMLSLKGADKDAIPSVVAS